MIEPLTSARSEYRRYPSTSFPSRNSLPAASYCRVILIGPQASKLFSTKTPTSERHGQSTGFGSSIKIVSQKPLVNSKLYEFPAGITSEVNTIPLIVPVVVDKTSYVVGFPPTISKLTV